jgi:hypothetical protein
MNIKKYVTYTVLSAVIVGASVSLSQKMNLIDHANASAEPTQITNSRGSNGGKYIQAFERMDRIPVIKNKALKTNQNYSVLEGKISRKLEPTGEKEITELIVEQPGRFYIKHTPDANNPSQFEEASNDGAIIHVKDFNGDIRKLEPMQNTFPSNQTASKDMIIPDYNGTYLPIGGVNELLHPEMFLQSAFSNGKVTIKGEEKFLERDTTVIAIDRESLEGKLGNRQTLWIDNQTGIILKLVNSDGDQPIQTIAFEHIRFSDRANEALFQTLK